MSLVYICKKSESFLRQPGILSAILFSTLTRSIVTLLSKERFFFSFPVVKKV